MYVPSKIVFVKLRCVWMPIFTKLNFSKIGYQVPVLELSLQNLSPLPVPVPEYQVK